MVIDGLQRFQLIQTGTQALKIRLGVSIEADSSQIWQTVIDHLRAYLDSQGLSSVMLERSDECPQQHAASGKFRHVWSEVHIHQSESVAQL